MTTVDTMPNQVTIKTTVVQEIAASDGDFGWVRLLLDDNAGRVVILSAYGDWSYRWDANGDAKLAELLSKLPSSYLAEKFLGSALSEHSDEKTIHAIRKAIIRDRKTGRWSKDEAAAEWLLVKDYENGWHSFHVWCGKTSYDCPGVYARSAIAGCWVGFWDNLWVPLIKPALESLAEANSPCHSTEEQPS